MRRDLRGDVSQAEMALMKNRMRSPSMDVKRPTKVKEITKKVAKENDARALGQAREVMPI